MQRWKKFTNYDFAFNTQTAPIVIAELGRAVRSLPLAFTKDQETFRLSAILGTKPNQNLYVDYQGRWLGGYVPAHFRSYPFYLENMELHFDEESGLISKTEGEPIFDRDGNYTKPVQDVFEFLKKIEQNRIATQKAVDALADKGLITEWKVKEIDGLYRADEAKLSKLSDNDYLQLRKVQAMPVIYGQLFSMANIGVFDKLSNIREKTKPEDPGFTLSDDGDLDIDWDKIKI